MGAMLKSLQEIRDIFDWHDSIAVSPEPFLHYKFADAVFDLCRDFECRLVEIERRLDALDEYRREQLDR